VKAARVVLIGPECTGKTWLAGKLAARYGVPWSPEHAREYVERHGEALTYADVEPIGRGQRAGEDAAIESATAAGAPLVVLDTDLVSTMVYSRHYYGDCPRWIEADAARRRADLYLLHHVDVPWVADGNQREQPERRGELFALFRATLAGLGARVADVVGSWDERRQRALGAIDALLAGGAGVVREVEELLDGAWPGAATDGVAAIGDGQLRLAAAVLMVSVVRADREGPADERRALERAVSRALDLPEEVAAIVARCAEDALDRGVRFPVVLARLARECSPAQKRMLVESLWRIAFADAELAGHEEYLVRKIAGVLGLSTADLVETKVRARESFLREDL